MTRPRPLVPRGDPSDTVRVVGEFGVKLSVSRAGNRRALHPAFGVIENALAVDSLFQCFKF